VGRLRKLGNLVNLGKSVRAYKLVISNEIREIREFRELREAPVCALLKLPNLLKLLNVRAKKRVAQSLD
jgi:hypothetical protein